VLVAFSLKSCEFLWFFCTKGQIFGGGKICPFACASQSLFGRGFVSRRSENFLVCLKARQAANRSLLTKLIWTLRLLLGGGSKSRSKAEHAFKLARSERPSGCPIIPCNLSSMCYNIIVDKSGNSRR